MLLRFGRQYVVSCAAFRVCFRCWVLLGLQVGAVKSFQPMLLAGARVVLLSGLLRMRSRVWVAALIAGFMAKGKNGFFFDGRVGWTQLLEMLLGRGWSMVVGSVEVHMCTRLKEPIRGATK